MAVAIQQEHKVKILSARECVIGKSYRRVTQPGKYYICARRIDDDGQALAVGQLVSLTHGNVIRLNLDLKEYVEVNITATATDVL